MNLTYYELSNLSPNKNFVLTKPIVDASEIDLHGTKIKIDTTFNPHMFAPAIHKVLSVPKKLIYGKNLQTVNIGGNRSSQNTDGSWHHYQYEEWVTRYEPIPDSMPWKCEMNVSKDDIIWVGYFSILRAKDENRVIICEGETYYLIPYQDIYLKKENDQVTMLNGWLLLAPIIPKDTELVRKLKDLGIIIPNMVNENDKLAVVRYIGVPVSEYLDDEKYDSDEVSLGDTVILNWGKNRRLEQSMTKFFSQEELIVSRRTNIAGVLRNDLFG